MTFKPNTEKCADPLCNVRPARWYFAGYCSRACYEVALAQALKRAQQPCVSTQK